jgi:acetyltransferase-like isoleucine patch superfamily enzyme
VSGRRHEIDRREVVIGDFVFVGEHATILMGCSIGHHSIVAAGAVVTEDMVVPPYSLVAGVPARVVRSIEHEIDAWVAESSRPGGRQRS